MVGPVAELVDAPDSKSGSLTGVPVRFRPGLPGSLIFLGNKSHSVPQNLQRGTLIGLEFLDFGLLPLYLFDFLLLCSKYV